MPVFGRPLAQVGRTLAEVEVMLPAVTRHRALIERLALDWPVPVRIVTGEAPKYAAFRGARAALAASGTVTLELALAGVPMVVAYKVSRAEEFIARRLIQVSDHRAAEPDPGRERHAGIRPGGVRPGLARAGAPTAAGRRGDA